LEQFNIAHSYMCKTQQRED